MTSLITLRKIAKSHEPMYINSMQEQERAVCSMFAVGDFMESLRGQDVLVVFRLLASLPQFVKTPLSFIEELKANIGVFSARIDDALRSNEERSWIGLCDQPIAQIREDWCSSSGTRFSDQSLLVRDQGMLLYYCLYVVLLWNHPLGHRRYQRGVIPQDLFLQRFQADPELPRANLCKGRGTDSWEQLFHFRNVLVLASAIKPTKRNKCLFIKIGCLLAEGRIHTLGGGQSFTAHRRCHVFTREENVFTPGYSMRCGVYGRMLQEQCDGPTACWSSPSSSSSSSAATPSSCSSSELAPTGVHLA